MPSVWCHGIQMSFKCLHSRNTLLCRPVLGKDFLSVKNLLVMDDVGVLYLNTWNMPMLRPTRYFRRLWRNVHCSGWYNGFHVRNTWGYPKVWWHSVLTYFSIAVVIFDTKQSNVLGLCCPREFISKLKGHRPGWMCTSFLRGRTWIRDAIQKTLK